MITISRILCPVDFSEASSLALQSALALARWYDAEVVVTHVAPIALPPTPFTPVPALLMTPGERRDIHRHLQGFIEAARPERVRVRAELHEGAAVEEILGIAEALSANLIVMGTHGRSGFEHLLLGSVTERVLRKTACPVLTVREDANPRPMPPPALFRSILCAIDFSPASLAALQYALSLSQESGGRIVLLHVPDWPAEVSGIQVLGQEAAEYQRRLMSESRLRLRAAVPESARVWCDVEERVAFGRPWETILEQARRGSADLIVVGAHGRDGVFGHLLGSTTDRLVRAADCAVLTVREFPAASPVDPARQAAATNDV